MLEGIKQWAMSVAGVAVLGSVCELVLPSGGYQKYLRLVMGMLLVLALASPIKRLLKIETPDTWMVETPEAAYRQREEMEVRQRQTVLDAYEKNLAAKLSTALTARLGDRVVQVRCQAEREDPERFGAIAGVTVVLDALDSEAEAEVYALLEDTYGIPEGQVEIRRSRADDSERAQETDSTGSAG